MAARLGGLARRISAPKGLLPTKGGGGGPVALSKAPTQALAEEDELIWDDGTVNPDYCLDQDSFTTGQGIGFLAAGLGVFGLVGFAAKVYNKPARVPFRPKEFPYDNLKIERGLA